MYVVSIDRSIHPSSVLYLLYLFYFSSPTCTVRDMVTRVDVHGAAAAAAGPPRRGDVRLVPRLPTQSRAGLLIWPRSAISYQRAWARGTIWWQTGWRNCCKSTTGRSTGSAAAPDGDERCTTARARGSWSSNRNISDDGSLKVTFWTTTAARRLLPFCEVQHGRQY